jgi:hypothetical protein
VCSMCCRKISDRMLDDGAPIASLIFLDVCMVIVGKIVMFSDNIVPC